MWERILTEVEIMPNADALKFHWQRCCWVFMFWSQASTVFLKLPSLSDFGWQIIKLQDEHTNRHFDSLLRCVWDSDVNLLKVEKTVDWYTKGCSCKTGCITNRCKCRKLKSDSHDGFCCPDCKCINCKNMHEAPISVDLDFSLSDVALEPVPSDESDMESDDEDDYEDPVQELEMIYLDINDTEV